MDQVHMISVSSAREAIAAFSFDPPVAADVSPMRAADQCDRCEYRGDLYHNTATGLSLCEVCDIHANQGEAYDLDLPADESDGHF